MAQNIVRNPDIVRAELRGIKNTSGKGWREIAQLEQYSPIPFGTLSAIYNGYPVPKRWYKKLGISEPIPTEPCPIHGVVHEYDCQAQVVKPRPKPRKPRTPRNEPGKAWVF